MSASFQTLTAQSRTVDASNDTSADFTPEASALLFASFHANAGTAPASPTIGDSQGLTWINVFNSTFNSTNRTRLAWALAPASPSLMSVWADWGGTTNGGSFTVSQSTGYHSTTTFASGSTVQATATSTSANVGTVPGMASTGNRQVLYVFTRSTTLSADAGWTEQADVAPGGEVVSTAIYTIGTPGDTTPTATVGNSPWRAMHFEIAEAPSASGGGSSSRARLNALRRRRRS